MKALIKRNMPILVIGGITLAIFLVIIFRGGKSEDTTNLEEVDLEALIANHTHVTGDLGAQFTLVEFSDFECPACATANPVVKRILDEYPDDIRFAYRHFPLPQHKDAKLAAQAAQAAGKQGAFWEYHDKLFENQDELKKADLLKYAEDLGLDVEQFKRELENGVYEGEVNTDLETGKNIGVNSTPTFYLNGKKLDLRSTQSLFQIVSFEIESNKTEALENNEETNANSNSSDKAVLLDQVTRPLTITYTEDGFTPKAPDVLIGQKIVWRNRTNRELTFNETTKTYPELESSVVIAPRGTFEFELTKEGLFAYREETQQHSALIVVTKLENN